MFSTEEFLTVVWYISKCAVLTISDNAVKIYLYVQYWPFLTVLIYIYISISEIQTISDSAVTYINMCSTDHFWQYCDIYRYVNYRLFKTVLWYITIYELVTISDSAVIYIDMCITDHFSPCWYIYRYVKYRPFLTVLWYISICAVLTISDNAVLYIPICAVLTISDRIDIFFDIWNTDHFWQCCDIYIYISICAVLTISDSAEIFRIQWIFYSKHCSMNSLDCRCALTYPTKHKITHLLLQTKLQWRTAVTQTGSLITVCAFPPT
jgi:hypothetical protein